MDTSRAPEGRIERDRFKDQCGRKCVRVGEDGTGLRTRKRETERDRHGYTLCPLLTILQSPGQLGRSWSPLVTQWSGASGGRRDSSVGP